MQPARLVRSLALSLSFAIATLGCDGATDDPTDGGLFDSGSSGQDGGTPQGDGGPETDAGTADSGPVDAGPQTPQVVSISPTDGESGFAPTAALSVTFNQEMNAGTIDADSFFVENAIGIRTAGVIAGSGTTFSFTPDAPWVLGTHYRVILTTAIEGAGALALAANFNSAFETTIPTWGTDSLLEADDLNPSFGASIASAADGSALALWHQSDGTRSNIWANHYTHEGGWEGPTLVENGDTGAAVGAISINSEGEGAAIWGQVDTDSGLQVPWVNRYTPGSGWGTAVQIAPSGVGGIRLSNVIIDEAGTITAIWSRQGGAYLDLSSNRQVRGEDWGAQELAEIEVNDATDAQLGVDDAGNVTLLFRRSHLGIRTNRYTPGSGWGTEEILTHDSISSSGGHSLAVNEAGDVVAIWYEQTTSSDLQSLWASRRSAAGAWEVPILIESDDGDHVNSPLVAMDPVGNAIAIWDQSDDSSIYSIRVNRYEVGTGWGEVTLLQSIGHVDDEIGYTQIDADSAGNFTAIWQLSESASGDDFLESIRFQAGGTWSDISELGTTAPRVRGAVALSVATDGSALATFGHSDTLRSTRVVGSR